MFRSFPYWNILLSFILAIFILLMAKITVQYLALETDVGFLKIKQWVIDNSIWRTAFFIHVFSSIFLLTAGFTQFYNPYQIKFKKVHRSVGRAYIVIILFISAPSVLIMSVYANGGFFSQTAFVTLSTLWIYFTWRGYKEARKKDFIQHGNFMMRSYALTLSALTLRAWKYILVMFFHPHPMNTYMFVAWLGWVPNLILAEWLIHHGLTSKILKPSK